MVARTRMTNFRIIFYQLLHSFIIRKGSNFNVRLHDKQTHIFAGCKFYREPDAAAALLEPSVFFTLGSAPWIMRHKRRLPAHAETSCSVAALLVNINSWSVFCTQPYTEHTLRDGGGAHAAGIINIYDCVRAQKLPLDFPTSLFFSLHIFHAEACRIFSTVWFRAGVFFGGVAFNISRPAVGDKQLISKLSLNFNGRPLKCQISADLDASENVSICSQPEKWRERHFLSLPLASNLTRQTHILQLNSVCALICTALLRPNYYEIIAFFGTQPFDLCSDCESRVQIGVLFYSQRN